MEYKILESTLSEVLEEMVNDHLSQWYKLQGWIIVGLGRFGYLNYIQAVVK